MVRGAGRGAGPSVARADSANPSPLPPSSRRYSYPLRAGGAQRVPGRTVLLVSAGVPAACLTAFALAAPPSRLETHATFLALASSLLITGAVTNTLKLGVGRPRPNFVARCWPGGAAPAFDAGGVPLCAPGAVGPLEGRKSFPSGHSSWSAAGLGFLSFWAAGKLRVWRRDAAGHPWRLVLASLPAALAVAIAVSRVQDYWHHASDVLAGLGIGATVAYATYRQSFHCFTSARAGEAHAAAIVVAAGSGGGRGDGGAQQDSFV